MRNNLRKHPPTLKSNPAEAGLYALGITLGLFLLLPIAQLITETFESKSIEVTGIEQAPPPPPPPEPPPPPDQKRQEEVDPLERTQPPPTIDQLELAINPGTGPAVGSFSLPSIDIASTLDDFIFDIADLTEKPTPIDRISPEDPPSRRRGGTVWVEFIVDSNGRVQRPIILSSDLPSSNDAVIRAISRWRFQPGRKDGRAVNTRVRLPFNFPDR